MYRYQHELLKNEAIYIAGPECFYTYGYDALAAMRKRAESLGFGVTLPNDDPLDLENPDLRKRADSIFENLKTIMMKTTAVVADLEAYRGAEPDAGTVYELGMAYAKGARCYGYTRDKRSLRTKNQGARTAEDGVRDEKNRPMAYPALPFSPCIIGSTKIVEGDFDDCLRMYETDIEEEWKQKGMRDRRQTEPETASPGACVREPDSGAAHDAADNRPARRKPLVYLSDTVRYEPDAESRYEEMKRVLGEMGFDAVSPCDPVPGTEITDGDNDYTAAARLFDRWQQHVRDCDIILADLNDFRGYEVSTDVGFECGMAFQLGKKMYGYMGSTAPMIERVPHFGPGREFRDHTGSNVENFNYPLNLMFACSMEIAEGTYRDAAGLIGRQA